MSDRLEEIFADFGGLILKDQMTTTHRIDKAKQALQSYIDTKIIEAVGQEHYFNRWENTLKENAYCECGKLAKKYQLDSHIRWHELALNHRKDD